jgi:hypothetical protein
MNPLMTIPPDACDPDQAAAAVDGAVAPVVDDELQPASRIARAAPAASAYGFIPVITYPAGFTTT